MIIKRREKPIELQKLETMIPRIHPEFHRLAELNHAEARRYKGYIGERKVDYHLEQLSDSHTILHDVNLQTKGQNFQIDTLVISDFAIYIIEIKNFNDTITFNTMLNQFTLDDGQKEIGYRYPITQAETAQLKLMNWLQEVNAQHIPIQYFIAISDPGTIIKVTGNEEKIAGVVAHGEYIPQKIMQADEQLKDQMLNEKQPRTSWSHQQIGQLILKKCFQPDVEIMKKYDITIRDILPGVICPKCEQLGMNRVYGTWVCEHCKFKSKRAHIRTLNDFFLIIKPTITNRECRWFLQIKSRYVAVRLLNTANFTYYKKQKEWNKTTT